MDFKTFFKEFLLLKENITRTSESEVSFYMEEVFGDLASNLEFIEVTQNNLHGHPKFDTIKFSFVYNNKKFVWVHSSAGIGARDSDNGSLTVTAFVYELDLETQLPASKNYTGKISNAFFSRETNDIGYDPVLRNGKSMLEFVKAGLSDNDGGNDELPEPTPSPSRTKIDKNNLVGV